MSNIDKYLNLVLYSRMNQLNIEQIKDIISQEFPWEWSMPPEISKGILTTNQAFIEAKKQSKNPALIASELKDEIQNFLNEKYIDLDVSVIGPYINLKPNDKYLKSFFLNKTTEINLPKKESTLLEFFSPNVGKRMHIGHMRGGNLGEATRRILSLTNDKIITNNHLGDWGIQFGILIWGVLNIDKLKLGWKKIDWENDANSDLIEKINHIYVATNELMENNETIKPLTQKITKLLETNLEEEKNNQTDIYIVWEKIVSNSLLNYSTGEAYLNLNKESANDDNQVISNNSIDKLDNKFGVWQLNNHHKDGQFDMVIGESFYQHFLNEIDYWVESGIATRESESVYIDLEEQKLGRCYLISSNGYSIYGARDIIARFIWAGLFDVDSLVTFADNRQSHSFNQVFAVIQLILDSGIYLSKPFGTLSQDETNQSLTRLQNKLPIHNKYGFISLPEGAMSSRRGTVILLEDFIKEIETAVKKSLEEKSKQPMRSIAANQKIQKISSAIIKWYDLARDREQDYIFDISNAIKFEGNTGIYQLYTIARLKNIIAKNETTAQLVSNPIQLLNNSEKEILTKMLTLESTILNISKNYKPHHLCSYLFELTSMINSWYAKHSVAGEGDDNRKDALLHFVTKIINHLEYTINLLGIETVDEL